MHRVVIKEESDETPPSLREGPLIKSLCGAEVAEDRFGVRAECSIEAHGATFCGATTSAPSGRGRERAQRLVGLRGLEGPRSSSRAIEPLREEPRLALASRGESLPYRRARA